MKVLKPERAVFNVVIKTLLADFQRAFNVALPLLVLGSFEEHGPVGLTLLQQLAENFACLCLVADAALKERAFEHHAPGLLQGHRFD